MPWLQSEHSSIWVGIGGRGSKRARKGVVGEVGARPGKCSITESKKPKGIKKEGMLTDQKATERESN